MRGRFIALSLAALLTLELSQAAAGQQMASPDESWREKVDAGALMCPWMIYLLLREIQKRCHPKDEEFGEKLDKLNRQLEGYFVDKKWVDQDWIDKMYAAMQKYYRDDHRSIDGDIRNICDSKDWAELYKGFRDNIEDAQRKIPDVLAHPPLMQTPHGSPCL